MKKTYDLYLELMGVIRGRFDLIEYTKKADLDSFLVAESYAFYGRKIIEAISFACLITVEHGMKNGPRSIKFK